MGSGSSVSLDYSSADASDGPHQYQLDDMTSPQVIDHLVSLSPEFGPYRRLLSSKSLDACTIDAVPSTDEDMMDFVTSLGVINPEHNTILQQELLRMKLLIQQLKVALLVQGQLLFQSYQRFIVNTAVGADITALLNSDRTSSKLAGSFLVRLFYRGTQLTPRSEDLARDWADRVSEWLLANEEISQDPFIQANLGYMYQYGLGVDVDAVRAVRYYQSAADQGCALAQNNLGKCFEFAIGTETNLKTAVKYYVLAAEQGLADAQFNAGVCLSVHADRYRNADLDAFRYFIAASEQGYDLAHGRTGFCFQKGSGVIKDESRAVGYYLRGVASGDPYAMTNLGYCYQKGVGVARDEAEAVRLYLLAAEQGDMEAQFNLGSHFKRKGDDAEAFKFFQLAADQGHGDSQYHLAAYFKSGVCVEKRLDKSIEYYELASKQGIALMKKKKKKKEPGKQEGRGKGSAGDDQLSVRKDEELAMTYMRHAADSGVLDAQLKMAHCFQVGIDGDDGNRWPKDSAEAIYYYRLVLDSGYDLPADVLNWIGCCYMNGIGLEQDIFEGFEFFKLAAAEGLVDGYVNVGTSYFHGIGTVVDIPKASQCYILAANKGDARGQYNLGVLLMGGQGIAKNEMDAVKYYSMAARQGYEPAIEALRMVDEMESIS